MDQKRERILFVCTANVDRSPTAEDLYAGDPRYQVLSAGTSPYATVPVTRQMLQWADRVFVMNERSDHHKSQLEALLQAGTADARKGPKQPRQIFHRDEPAKKQDASNVRRDPQPGTAFGTIEGLEAPTVHTVVEDPDLGFRSSVGQ